MNSPSAGNNRSRAIPEVEPGGDCRTNNSFTPISRKPVLGRVEGFLFPRASDSWLAILRIGMALQIIIYCFSLRADWMDLFSLQSAGIIRRDLSEALLSANSHYIPRLGWLVNYTTYFDGTEQMAITAAWWILLTGAFFLLVGIFSRETAVVTIFLHLCAVKSTSGLTYGVDNFVSIGLFYILIAPLPDQWAADCWLRGVSPKNLHLQGFHRRTLQLHLCLIYSEMRRSRLVEWPQHLACANSTAVQFASTRDTDCSQESVSLSRDFRLPPGDWISIIHLAAKDPCVLAGGNLDDASGNRTCDGVVWFCARHDHPQSRSLRVGSTKGAR